MNKKNMVNYDFGDLKNQFPKEPETVHQSVLCTLQKLTEKSEGKGDSISGKHYFFRKRKVALAAAIVCPLIMICQWRPVSLRHPPSWW